MCGTSRSTGKERLLRQGFALPRNDGGMEGLTSFLAMTSSPLSLRGPRKWPVAISGSWGAIVWEFQKYAKRKIASSCLTALLAMTKEGGTPRNDKGKVLVLLPTAEKKGHYGNPYRGPKLCTKNKECAREDSNLRSTAPEAVALSY